MSSRTPPPNDISPVRNGTPSVMGLSPLPNPNSDISPVIKNTTAATPPLINSPVKAESPDSHCSTYSAVYSPPVQNPNGDSNFCDGSGIGKVRRQRLRPWLINQINSGEIPGLVWIDKENMIFKIPWKHFGRPGVDMYLDALLFRRWALHTKKFEQGRPSDISTWKTRFRCALHKLPDIEELNDQNQTEGEEPYRVYKFRKIELEKIPRDRGGPPDDESIGSVGSPISASYPVENTTFGPNSDSYRSPTSSISSYKSSIVTPGLFPKHELIDSNHLSYQTKRYINRSKPGGMPASEIQKWQTYDRMRMHDSYSAEKSIMGDINYDNEQDSRKHVLSSKERITLQDADKYSPGDKYQGVEYETDEDDMPWSSRSGVSINQSAHPTVSSIMPRYSTYYSPNSPKRKGFEPYERHYERKPSDVGVIKNAKLIQKRPNLEIHEEDDNELFFQSCAKRIKKLDSKSSGYLKLKILEQFFYVENMFENQYNSQGHQSSYRYSSDPPPLISSANVKASEQGEGENSNMK